MTFRNCVQVSKRAGLVPLQRRRETYAQALKNLVGTRGIPLGLTLTTFVEKVEAEIRPSIVQTRKSKRNAGMQAQITGRDTIQDEPDPTVLTAGEAEHEQTEQTT